MGIQINNQNIQLNNTTVQGILNLMYPVGSIYISTSPYNPKDIFGGSTWRQIEDVFLLAAGATYNGGDTGGEAEHTLTTSEMPYHYHNVSEKNATSYVFTNGLAGTGTGKSFKQITASWEQANFTDDSNNRLMTGAIGSSNSHNNMPPYLVVYVWERIA